MDRIRMHTLPLLLLFVSLLLGCPESNTKPMPSETAAPSVSPSIDPFVPRDPLDAPQVTTAAPMPSVTKTDQEPPATPFDAAQPAAENPSVNSFDMPQQPVTGTAMETPESPKTVLDEPKQSTENPAVVSFGDQQPTTASEEPKNSITQPEPPTTVPPPPKPDPAFSDIPAAIADEKKDDPGIPVTELRFADSSSRTTNHEPRTTSTYDPIAANGKYFENWPKPKLLLVFTGFMNGYVEPCGCAGIEQMKGGLSRRRTFMKELAAKGWPVMPIDAGNLNKGFGLQEEYKYSFVIDESLRLMDYGIVGLGNRELLFPTEVLILYGIDVPGSPKRYTSANVAVLDFDPTIWKPFRTETIGGVKVGVVSVIGKSLLQDVNNPDIKQADAVANLQKILPDFEKEACDQRVLIVHGSNAEFEKILATFPNKFDFAIGSDGPAEPPAQPNWDKNTMLVEVGEKGKYAIAVGIYDDADTPIRYQRIALDSRFANDKDIMNAMQFYQDQLKSTGLSKLGIKPIPNGRTATNGIYVGSKACADCHEPSYVVWRKSGHARAWNTLANISKPARTFDPECIACHVVGWSPAEFLPYENGFMGEKETPQLIDVGCESCHGPGEKHVTAEKSGDDATKNRFRKAVRMTLQGNTTKKLCMECHDGDNSPDFDFDKYWPKVEHKESSE